MTLTLTFSGQIVTFVVDVQTGRYTAVRLQSIGGGAVERIPDGEAGPVLDHAIRERIMQSLPQYKP